MTERTTYAVFIQDCREDRKSILAMIQKMESGQLGVGTPITLPKMNAATTNLVASYKRTVADLDTIIAEYEAHPHA